MNELEARNLVHNMLITCIQGEWHDALPIVAIDTYLEKGFVWLRLEGIRDDTYHSRWYRLGQYETVTAVEIADA